MTIVHKLVEYDSKRCGVTHYSPFIFFFKQLDHANQTMMEEKKLLEKRNVALRTELERLKAEASRPASCESSRVSRESPIFLEYSPSTKPSQSPRPLIIDPVAEGLLPALPICYPRPSLYPYLDLTPSLPRSSFEVPAFLPIHLRV
uniref:Uncharacterized protein n=1 Tax=Heterorhabditis bacteriophora TaxID=37862 RepID=A0A1I7X8J1_HETBA